MNCRSIRIHMILEIGTKSDKEKTSLDLNVLYRSHLKISKAEVELITIKISIILPAT
jgi:hypothetical protein